MPAWRGGINSRCSLWVHDVLPLFDAFSVIYFLSDILFETRSHVVQATPQLTVYVGLALNL